MPHGLAFERGMQELHIGFVVHKAFVETNEEGTEAAAATGAVMKPASAAPDPETPFTFRADRPFLFAIVHGPTGLPLFLGQVSHP